MAIVKIGVISDPAAVGDYTRIVAHLNAFARQVSGNQFILTDDVPTALALGAYIQHGGVVYQVQTADEAISGTPADGTYYIKVAASGAVLVATWITDISGYSWSAIYNCLTAVDESQLLPYMIVVSGTATVYTKYKLEYFGQRFKGDLNVAGNGVFGTLAVTGALSAATVNTGGGAYEVYKNTSAYYATVPSTITIAAMDVGEVRFIGILILGLETAATLTLKAPSTGSTYNVVMSGDGNIAQYGGLFSVGATLYTAEIGISAQVKYGVIIRRES